MTVRRFGNLVRLEELRAVREATLLVAFER
jgi:hypothetical protein